MAAARLLRAPPARAAARVGLVLMAGAVPRAAVPGDWGAYLGDEGRSHFSALDQLNTGNVHRLAVAWTYRPAGAAAEERTQIQCNPLIIDGVFYGTTATQLVVALDAATGRERWRFDPRTQGRSRTTDRRHRGLAAWTGDGERRLLYAQDNYLYALDAGTGRLVSSFGDGGLVDFKPLLGRDPARITLVNSGTPGVVYGDLYILPTRTTEQMGAAPGHILAFDIRTGRLAWRFHTIPHPGEFGHETWPAGAWETAGGANCWAGMALDAERGLVFVPTGSAAYDFWGGNRPGENLFANSLICLDARTGKRVWHYQTVRHDIWDRDLPAPPNLLTVRREGRSIPAVAQVTKSGHVFVFNRETGEPLFPIEEIAVPASDIPGESAWPTQPRPLQPEPFSRQAVHHEDLTQLSPAAHRAALERFARLRPSVPFQPPSREGTLVVPGLDGGGEWGGAAVTPDGVMYVNGSDTPWILTMVEAAEGGRASGQDIGRATYAQFCAGCHRIDRTGNPLQNIPALTDVGGRLSREELHAVIAGGRGIMPAFGFLSASSREVLVDHLLGRLPTRGAAAPAAAGSAAADQASIPWVVSYERWLDAEGYPAVKPPWGTLNAIDLNTGEYLWKVPLGEIPALTARGLPPTGTANYGGPVVTAGGLVFIGATSDNMIRAFDRKTGRLLWQAPLPTGGYATPATYLANGRQFVVIACGGGKLGSKSDDVYVAFALPN